ncbi:hypothetical protein C1890_01300 [Pseudomonas sp. DP16D-R1]|nr:hypothetical protein C1890_01300 [Pseudomonas sp. DP16D-R1]
MAPGMKSTLSTVGVSLLAMVCQSTPMCMTFHREQARSYRDLRELRSRCRPRPFSVVRLARTCAARRRCTRRSGG